MDLERDLLRSWKGAAGQLSLSGKMGRDKEYGAIVSCVLKERHQKDLDQRRI